MAVTVAPPTQRLGGAGAPYIDPQEAMANGGVSGVGGGSGGGGNGEGGNGTAGTGGTGNIGTGEGGTNTSAGGGGGYGGAGGNNVNYYGGGGGAGGSVGPTGSVFQPYSNGGGGGGNGANGLVEISWTTPGPLTFDPSEGDFGTVEVGKTATLTLTVTNSGDGTLNPSAITPNGPGITITGGTCAVSSEIAALQSCTIELTWTPSAAGALVDGLVTIAYPYGDSESNSVSLIGTATDPVPSPTPTPSDTAPTKPRSIKSTGGPTAKSFKVSWKKPAKGTATAYRVRVNVKGKAPIIIERSLGSDARSTTFTRKQLLTATGISRALSTRGDLVQDLVYRVRVQAVGTDSASKSAATFIVLAL